MLELPRSPPRPPRARLPKLRLTTRAWSIPRSRSRSRRIHRTKLCLLRSNPRSPSAASPTHSMSLRRTLRWTLHHRSPHLCPRPRLRWPRCRVFSLPQMLPAPLNSCTSPPTPLRFHLPPSLSPKPQTTSPPRPPVCRVKQKHPFLPPNLSQNLRLPLPSSPSRPTPLTPLTPLTPTYPLCFHPSSLSQELFHCSSCPSSTRTPCIRASPRLRRAA